MDCNKKNEILPQFTYSYILKFDMCYWPDDPLFKTVWQQKIALGSTGSTTYCFVTLNMVWIIEEESGVRLSVTPDLHAIPHSALDYQACDSHLFLSPKVYSIGDKRILRINLESQAKLLGHFTVFLPSRCWCARFGELTVIHNIGRTIKKQHLVEVSLLFLSETVGKNHLNLNFIAN